MTYDANELVKALLTVHMIEKAPEWLEKVPKRDRKMGESNKQANTQTNKQGKFLVPSSQTMWNYRLGPDGLRVDVEFHLPEKTITITNTMDWDTFIQGLSLGWKLYLQDNPELTQKLNAFIEQQVAAGNYIIPGEESTAKTEPL